MLNHLIEGHDLWIVRQEQYLDIRTLGDWQKHIPAGNRFGSEAAFRQARIPQWDVASVACETGSTPADLLIKVVQETVPTNAAVARAYPQTGRIELAGVVQYVEQMLEAVKQHEGESGVSTVTAPTAAAPTTISRPVGVAGPRDASVGPRNSAAVADQEAPTAIAKTAQPVVSPVAGSRHVSQTDLRLGILTIRSQADGVVTEILVKDGQQVHPGDVVARLDSEEIKLELEAAQVRLEDTARTLARMNALGSAGNTISVSELEKARSSRQLAEIELKRCKLRLQRTEIKSTWDGKICGDRYKLRSGSDQPSRPRRQARRRG